MLEVNLLFNVRELILSLRQAIKKNTKIIGTGLILFCMLFLFIGILTTNSVEAKVEPKTKQVVSIQIQKGDTLWSIANEYISDEYESLNEYIDEIKMCNGLVSDTIHEGAYLIVPYFE